MGCGCGKRGGTGGRRQAAAPKLSPNNQKITENAGRLHPSVAKMQNIQKLAEERRKVERLKREQLLKALARP